MSKIFATLLSLLIVGPQASAYYETLETGEILLEDQYRLNLSTQFVTDHDTGINLTGRMAARIDDASEVSVMLGIGTTDFLAGGFYKWVPYPDFKKQPAIGILAGLMYARVDRFSEMSLRFQPFVSKKFHSEWGPFIPFASLPTGIRSFDGETTIPIQFALGSEFAPEQFEHIRFVGEVGFNLSNAFTYITIGATILVDEDNGFQLN